MRIAVWFTFAVALLVAPAPQAQTTEPELEFHPMDQFVVRPLWRDNGIHREFEGAPIDEAAAKALLDNRALCWTTLGDGCRAILMLTHQQGHSFLDMIYTLTDGQPRLIRQLAAWQDDRLCALSVPIDVAQDFTLAYNGSSLFGGGSAQDYWMDLAAPNWTGGWFSETDDVANQEGHVELELGLTLPIGMCRQLFFDPDGGPKREIALGSLFDLQGERWGGLFALVSPSFRIVEITEGQVKLTPWGWPTTLHGWLRRGLLNSLTPAVRASFDFTRPGPFPCCALSYFFLQP